MKVDKVLILKNFPEIEKVIILKLNDFESDENWTGLPAVFQVTY